MSDPVEVPFAEEVWVVAEASTVLVLMTAVVVVTVSTVLATEMVDRAGVTVLEEPLEVLGKLSRAEA
jgi:hypothetical protein